MSNCVPGCVLCFSLIVNHNDKNLNQGRGQFKVFEEISSLHPVVHCPSPYICKSCGKASEATRTSG